mmetsp:Transcript_34297/g.53496  ORF Transcript_34297/g.53496 Transcript_34297/m.53496 type:complete len:271 (-) Transcript_34297:159-971(-)
MSEADEVEEYVTLEDSALELPNPFSSFNPTASEPTEAEGPVAQLRDPTNEFEQLEEAYRTLLREDVSTQTKDWLKKKLIAQSWETNQQVLQRILSRDDISGESKEWLQRLLSSGPGMLGRDEQVMKVFVSDTYAGRKIEVVVSKIAKVYHLRQKLRQINSDHRFTTNGDGFETYGQSWPDGRLVFGVKELSDNDSLLHSYGVKEGSVIFAMDDGGWQPAFVDPDLASQSVIHMGEMIRGKWPMTFLRHENRGPGGVSGNGDFKVGKSTDE